MNLVEKYKNIGYLLISPMLLVALFATITLYNSDSDKYELITLACSGKTTNISESSKWPTNYRSWENTAIYTASKNLPDKNSNEKTWMLKKDNGYGDSTESNAYTTDGVSHSSSTYLSVTEQAITLTSQSNTGFDPNKGNSDPMNQANEHRRDLKINRYTGEWSEDSYSRTSWKDGSWLSDRSITKGSCEKGVKKF